MTFWIKINKIMYSLLIMYAICSKSKIIKNENKNLIV